MITDKYPIHYRGIAARGYQWMRQREAHCQELVIWRHIETQQIIITLRMNGRIEEFHQASTGELSIARPESKPDVNSAHDMLAFAKAGDAEVVWLDETTERSLQVRNILQIDNADINERLKDTYGDN